MSYAFEDTTTHAAVTPPLPAEAVSVNGTYIEDAISGYRTLYVKGRESMAKEIDSFSVGTADGETVRSTRYPARTLTVGFQIIAESNNDFREKFNHLNNILSQGEADFVFRDEADKFFTGIPIMDIDVDPGRNAVTGEWQIYCAYPFKRSIAVIEATPTTINNTDAQFNIAYGGNYPTKPILRAEFAGALSGGNWSEDGDCGFVAWVDADENIVQVGNTEAIELAPEYTAAQIINRTFTTLDDFATTGGATWGNKVVAGSLTPNQAIPDAYWNNGRGQTLQFAKPTYGAASAWHGPIAHYAIQEGMVNYEIGCMHRMCANANAQCGSFELGAYNINDGEYTLLTGFVIEKVANGTTGTVRYIVNGEQVGTDGIDLSFYNTHFGYCRRDPIYTQQKYAVKVKKKVKRKKKKKKTVTVTEMRTRTVLSGYRYSQSNLNSTIKKAGSAVTFKVGNIAARTFTVADVETMAAHDVSMHFGQSGTIAALHTNAVSALKCTRMGGPKFTDYQNTFTSGDVVDADTSDASVILYRAGSEAGDGQLEPQYGALGNNWEDFQLRPNSTNTIAVTWSPWVNPNYKPTFKILYNEVFI